MRKVRIIWTERHEEVVYIKNVEDATLADVNVNDALPTYKNAEFVDAIDEGEVPKEDLADYKVGSGR